MNRRGRKVIVYVLVGVLLILSTVAAMQYLKKINTYKEVSQRFAISTVEGLATHSQSAISIIEMNSKTYTIEELNRLSLNQSYIIMHYQDFFDFVFTEDFLLRADPIQYYVIRNIDTRLKEAKNSGEKNITLSGEELKEIDQFKHICEIILIEYEHFLEREDRFVLDNIRIFVESLTENSREYLFPHHSLYIR